MLDVFFVFLDADKTDLLRKAQIKTDFLKVLTFK